MRNLLLSLTAFTLFAFVSPTLLNAQLGEISEEELIEKQILSEELEMLEKELTYDELMEMMEKQPMEFDSIEKERVEIWEQEEKKRFQEEIIWEEEMSKEMMDSIERRYADMKELSEEEKEMFEKELREMEELEKVWRDSIEKEIIIWEPEGEEDWLSFEKEMDSAWVIWEMERDLALEEIDEEVAEKCEMFKEEFEARRAEHEKEMAEMLMENGFWVDSIIVVEEEIIEDYEFIADEEEIEEFRKLMEEREMEIAAAIAEQEAELAERRKEWEEKMIEEYELPSQEEIDSIMETRKAEFEARQAERKAKMDSLLDVQDADVFVKHRYPMDSVDMEELIDEKYFVDVDRIAIKFKERVKRPEGIEEFFNVDVEELEEAQADFLEVIEVLWSEEKPEIIQLITNGAIIDPEVIDVEFTGIVEEDEEGIELLKAATSIETASAASISVYPNPAADYVQVASNNVLEISLVNLTGQVIKTVTNTNHLTLEDLVAGMYIINVTTVDNAVYTQSLIKN